MGQPSTTVDCRRKNAAPRAKKDPPTPGQLARGNNATIRIMRMARTTPIIRIRVMRSEKIGPGKPFPLVEGLAAAEVL